jgi:hypothetical protein
MGGDILDKLKDAQHGEQVRRQAESSTGKKKEVDRRVQEMGEGVGAAESRLEGWAKQYGLGEALQKAAQHLNGRVTKCYRYRISSLDYGKRSRYYLLESDWSPENTVDVTHLVFTLIWDESQEGSNYVEVEVDRGGRVGVQDWVKFQPVERGPFKDNLENLLVRAISNPKRLEGAPVGYREQRVVLEALIRRRLVPPQARPVIRVREFGEKRERKHLALYVAEERPDPLDGSERLFLVAHSDNRKPVGLVLAPRIPNLRQEIEPSGRYVHYLDARGKPLLYADACSLEGKKPGLQVLKALLDASYAEDSPYVQGAIYPRFYIPLSGARLSFYGIDRTLTGDNIKALFDAYSILSPADAPQIDRLAQAILGADLALIVVDKLDEDGRRALRESGILSLDSTAFLAGPYLLAAMLVIEGAERLMNLKDKDAGVEAGREEGKSDDVPGTDLQAWSVDKVLEALRLGKIEAESVALWALLQMKRGDPHLSEAIAGLSGALGAVHSSDFHYE